LNDSYVKQDQEFLIQINNLNQNFDKHFPGIPSKFSNINQNETQQEKKKIKV
jgi:hypothetical protein